MPAIHDLPSNALVKILIIVAVCAGNSVLQLMNVSRRWRTACAFIAIDIEIVPGKLLDLECPSQGTRNKMAIASARREQCGWIMPRGERRNCVGLDRAMRIIADLRKCFDCAEGFFFPGDGLYAQRLTSWTVGQVLRCVTHSFKSLRFVDIHHQHTVHEKAAVAFVKKCPHLERFGIAETGLGDRTVQALVLHCKGLNYLDIGHNRVTEKGLELLSSLIHLSVLKINYINTHRVVDISSIARCTNLQLLDIEGYYSFAPSYEAWQCIPQNLQRLHACDASISRLSFSHIIRTCVWLKELELDVGGNDDHAYGGEWLITDEVLAEISQHCTHLIKLSFAYYVSQAMPWSLSGLQQLRACAWLIFLRICPMPHLQYNMRSARQLACDKFAQDLYQRANDFQRAIYDEFNRFNKSVHPKNLAIVQI